MNSYCFTFGSQRVQNNFLTTKKTVTSLVPWNLDSNHATGFASLPIMEVQKILEKSCN